MSELVETMKPIRVLIVEDSPLMRNFLSHVIGNADGFKVVATAHNAADAWEKIVAERPDVVTLDVELPDQSGLTILERLTQGNSPSVVMVSSLTQSGAQTTLRALQLGAVDFIGKSQGNHGVTDAWVLELLVKLRRAATVRPAHHVHRIATKAPEPPVHRSGYRDKLIVVGAGSGSVDTANRLIAQLPSNCPPVVVALQLSLPLVQALIPMVARRATVRITLVEREEILRPGHVYLGADDRHLVVSRVGQTYHVSLRLDEPIRNMRPNIDWLLESAAHECGAGATGIVLDAAGEDGTAGLKALVEVQGRALRQARELRVRERVSVPVNLRDRGLAIRELSTEQIIDLLFGAAATR